MPTHAHIYIVRTGLAIFHENPNKHTERAQSPEKPIQQTACLQCHNTGKQRSTAPYAELVYFPVGVWPPTMADKKLS